MEDIERLEWKKTIRYNIFMLQLVGLWPKGNEAYRYSPYTLYAILTVTVFQLANLFFQTVNLYFIRDDLEAITGSIYILLTEYGAILKTFGLVRNMKMLKELMVTLDSDLFQPKTLQQRELAKASLRVWTRVVSIYWFFVFGCLFFWCSFPVFDKTYKDYRLPFLAWFPYDTKTFPQYELTYLYQAVAVNVTALSNINTDTLIAALNMYIGAQFDILCHNLRNLNESGKETSENVNRKLKSMIHHHKEILKFADKANKFYNVLLFVQFFISGIATGISMFQLTVLVPFSSQFYALLSYTNGLFVQIFMYCWFGEETVFKSSKLSYALFACDWTDFSTEVKQNLLFFLFRLQKSFKISALGLFYLSLDTFVTIIRTSFSYFTLLRQVNSPTEIKDL